MNGELREPRGACAAGLRDRNNSMLPAYTAETSFGYYWSVNWTPRIKRRPRGRKDERNFIHSGNAPLTTIRNGLMVQGFRG
jgi:hypothetical protein